MTLVSVIIPYFKKRDYIKRSLDSVLNQTYKNYEIIVIYDDTNLDDLSYIKKITENKSKIKVIINKKNLGAGRSRNIGIENSNGKIIAFLDSDDEWLPEKLEKQLKFMLENKYKFTFCNYDKIDQKKKIKVNSKTEISYKKLLFDCEIGLSTVLLDRNIVKKDLFPPTKTKEDYLAWLKITKDNVVAHNLPESLVIWNQSKESLSSSFLQKISDGFRVYYFYLNFNLFKSIYHLIILSLNSLRRKF